MVSMYLMRRRDDSLAVLSYGAYTVGAGLPKKRRSTWRTYQYTRLQSASYRGYTDDGHRVIAGVRTILSTSAW